MVSTTRMRSGDKIVMQGPILWLQLGENRRKECLLTALQTSGYQAEFHEHLPREQPENREEVIVLSLDESFRLLESGFLHALANIYRLCAELSPQVSRLLEKAVKSEVDIFLSVTRSSGQMVQQFSAAQGYKTYVDPQIQAEMVEVVQTKSDDDGRDPFIIDEEDKEALYLDYAKAYARLTASECRVLDAILKGKSNRKIAEDDYLSVSTVNNHVSQLTKKLEANDRTHAVKRVIELEWLRGG
ncbi:response regulator transcription factor [Natribacillus halophilus]|uniref:Regulatory protein, luxR family n=1 Tax=Natribacillus halophilus TaxID=549003 RepID=A0A1G8KNU6_9BACI|nr:LuxR C-terminal-related transcriptional regulator [Natribacillus halophilus]SDI45022.1 regulatory protein, luxR family [Natribacillus halophilus]